MIPAEAVARLRLARTDGIGPVTFRRLLGHAWQRGRCAGRPAAHGARRGAPLTLCPEAEALREMDALRRMGGRFDLRR